MYSLYEDVRFFSLVTYPGDIGRGSRVCAFEGLIHFIKGYDSIRFATYSDVVDWCLKQLKGDSDKVRI